MLEARIGRRMRALDIDNYQSYYELVEGSEREKTLFVDQITTHETSFFRTPRIWQYLQTEFLPSWHLQNPNTIFNVWSAATSSGEEAYSLAMVLNQFAKKSQDFNFRVTATDISAAMIEKCEQATYQKRSVAKLLQFHPSLSKQYLIKNGQGYRVNRALLHQISFRTHNLFSEPEQVAAFDLVLLRNVLIYFEQADQNQVLANIHSTLKQGGMLIIGESESILHADASFTNLEPGIYHSVPSAPCVDEAV